VEALFRGVESPLMECAVAEGLPPWPLLMRRRAPESQFDVLLEVARHEAGLPPVLVALAGSGTRFHGSGGRPWVALEGNLHVCVVLSLSPPRPLPLPLLTPLVVTAMAEAVEALPGFGGRVGIKWVNDLLVNGQKVGGALAATLMQGGEVGSVVLGFGLNVARTPQVERALRSPPAASLDALAGPEGSGALHPGSLLGSVLRGLEVALVRLQLDPEVAKRDILTQYRRRSVILGSEVEVVEEVTSQGAGSAGPPVRGRVRAIGPGLELYLEGHPHPITRGRLMWPIRAPSDGGASHG